MVNTYRHEISDHFLCVPACLNMVFRRRGLPTYSQEEIAYQLGLVVPPSSKAEYPDARTDDNERQWGVHPQTEEYSISKLLSTLGIPLEFKFISVTEVLTNEAADFIVANIGMNNDMIVGYDYKTVFDEGKNYGHVSLISDIDAIRDLVTMVDPEEVNPVRVLLSKLIKGIRIQRDGFWIIAPNEMEILTHMY